MCFVEQCNWIVNITAAINTVKRPWQCGCEQDEVPRNAFPDQLVLTQRYCSQSESTAAQKDKVCLALASWLESLEGG